MSIQRKSKSGKFVYRFVVSYEDEKGNKKQKGSKFYKTKKEAQQAELKFLFELEEAKREKEKPENVNAPKTFADFQALWIEYSTQGQAITTIEDKRRILKVNCSCLMDRPIREITTQDILAIFRTEDFTRLSTTRKEKIYMYLNCVFSLAADQYGLEVNPMKKIPKFKPTEEEKMKEVEILEITDFNSMLKQIPSSKNVIRDLFFWLYWTGMRSNEARSLLFEDIDIEKKQVKITKQYDHNHKVWRPLKTKGAKRTIDIDDDLLQIYLKQYEYYKKEPDFSAKWFVFGGPIHLPNTTIQRTKNQAIKKAGLKQVKIHSFRHSHASNLLARGVSPFNISKRLGHASIQTTLDIYGHLMSEKDLQILEAICEKSGN